MALKVELANKAANGWTDITDKVKVFDGMRVGGNAHLGEVGTGSGFDLDDDAGSVSLPVKRVVRIRDTKTSPDTILLRGRIAEKGVARGALPLGDARAFDVQLDDQNVDLRGIPVRSWSRPKETDYRRVIALWRRFLKGSPRASTRLRIDYVRNANRTMLPKQTYRDTDPYEIWRDIAEAAAKEFFVTADGEMFHDLPLSTKYAADLSITDDAPNMVDEFPPVFGAAGDYDGSEFLSGATLTYGKKKRVSVVRSTVETAHDYWREIIPMDATGQADARKRLKTLMSSQAREDLTITCDLELTDAQMDMIKYGQTVSFRSAAAGVLTPRILRVGRLMWEPVAPRRYIAHLELGFPKKLSPRIRRSTPPTGPVVTPPTATTWVPLDDFDRSGGTSTLGQPTVPAREGWTVWDVTGDPTTIYLRLPSGVGVGGRLLLVGMAWTSDAGGVPTAMTGHGFTALGSAQTSGNHSSQFFYRVITGAEGWSGYDYLAVATQGLIMAVMWVFEDWYDDDGPSIIVETNATATPPAISDTTWPSGTAVAYVAALVAGEVDTITAFPSGYTDHPVYNDADLGAGNTHNADFDAAIKYSTDQSETPPSFACSDPAISFTVAVRGGSAAGVTTDLGSIPLQAETGGWWPGGNEWQSYFAGYAGDHGIEDGAFFAESSDGHETSGNNWIISLLGRGHPDGTFPVLPMQVDDWELEMRYRLLGAAGSLTDPGLRYMYLDWMFAGSVRLNFGDATNAEGIQAIGETTATVSKPLAGVGNWGRVRLRWRDGQVYVREWAESVAEPGWDASVAVLSAIDPDDIEFDIKGRLGNASGAVQRVEIDWIRMLAPDSSRNGNAGEVYGVVQVVAA